MSERFVFVKHGKKHWNEGKAKKNYEILYPFSSSLARSDTSFRFCLPRNMSVGTHVFVREGSKRATKSEGVEKSRKEKEKKKLQSKFKPILRKN